MTFFSKDHFTKRSIVQHFHSMSSPTEFERVEICLVLIDFFATSLKFIKVKVKIVKVNIYPSNMLSFVTGNDIIEGNGRIIGFLRLKLNC